METTILLLNQILPTIQDYNTIMLWLVYCLFCKGYVSIFLGKSEKKQNFQIFTSSLENTPSSSTPSSLHLHQQLPHFLQLSLLTMHLFFQIIVVLFSLACWCLPNVWISLVKMSVVTMLVQWATCYVIPVTLVGAPFVWKSWKML